MISSMRTLVGVATVRLILFEQGIGGGDTKGCLLANAHRFEGAERGLVPGHLREDVRVDLEGALRIARSRRA